MIGDANANTFKGNGGNDTFFGTLGADILMGGEGVDTLTFANIGAGIQASLKGGGTGEAAGDTYDSIENLVGSRFKDVLRGDTGNNYIEGGAGNDSIFGGAGNDKLIGGAGKDHLLGGDGNNIMTGGAGKDIFHINSFTFVNHITDFTRGDKLHIEHAGFGNLPVGGLKSAWFYSGSSNKAHDADDHFIYRTSDDTLWFDADGKGGQASKLVIDFDTDIKLVASDILMV